jgi:hypothetical protein
LLSGPPAHRFTVSGGGHRASQVPGEPQSVHALLFDPGGMGYARPLRHVYAAFRRLESVGSRDAVISGLYYTACTRAISSFAASVARALRKTRFRLVANLYRVGLTTHWVPPHYFKTASLAISPKCPGFSWRTFSTAWRPIRPFFA